MKASHSPVSAAVHARRVALFDALLATLDATGEQLEVTQELTACVEAAARLFACTLVQSGIHPVEVDTIVIQRLREHMIDLSDAQMAKAAHA